MPVPTTPAELDAPWLTGALATTDAFRGVRVRDFEARIIGVGYGLDSTIAHVALKTEGGPAAAPRGLVAKFAPGERGRAEIAFYEQIAPAMPVRLPNYYAGFPGEGEAGSLLLLEDLTGAVQGDAIVGATRGQAEVVLTAMARYHAAFHGAKQAELAGLRLWGGELSGNAQKLGERLPLCLERHAERLGARAADLLRGLPARLPEALGAFQGATPTLLHTDLHLDNVVFLEPDLPVILDWPQAARGPAMLDVVRCFVEGMSLEVRRRHGATLLEGYRRERERAGAPLASAERTAAQYQAGVLRYLASAAAWGGVEEPGFEQPRVQAIFENLLRNTIAAALDL